MARRRGQAKRIEIEIVGAVEKVVGQFQLRALQVLSSATPVDTGFARAGWTPSTGSPVTERLDPPKDERDARSKARALRSRNLARAKQIAATYKVRFGSAFLSNNVPYMEFLNRGSSAQAGAKFVERGIEQTVRSFKGRRL